MSTKKTPKIMTPPTLISIVNSSSRVTDGDVAEMVSAIGVQLARDVAPIWGQVPALEFVVRGGTPRGMLCTISDTPDQPGAAGYHDEDANGVPYIKVFTFAGAPALVGADALSVTLSHEILEVVGDSPANKWADGPDGFDYAFELCLDGATLVRLADGSEVAIRELAERGGFFDVRACGPDGNTVSARAGHARMTARDAETILVTFTDGTKLRCTDGHKVLMEDGSFVAAGALVPGMVLRKDVFEAASSMFRLSRVGRPALYAAKPAGASVVPCRFMRPRASSDSALHGKIVDSVEPGGRSDVYDLTVPGVRNFAIGAGIFVHNCDAVEGDTYAIAGVSVSNFVYPAFFDPRAQKGSKLAFLDTVKKPFAMSRGGYQIKRSEPGKVTQVFARDHHAIAQGLVVEFGPDFPEQKKAAKIAKAARRRRP